MPNFMVRLSSHSWSCLCNTYGFKSETLATGQELFKLPPSALLTPHHCLQFEALLSLCSSSESLGGMS